MHIRLIAVGRRLPAWIETGFAEYAGRLPAQCRLELVEIPLGKRRRPQDAARARADEGRRMLAAVRERDRVIALEVDGRSLDTEALAAVFADWQGDGRDVALLIGGPDGLDEDCRKRAEWHWSLSRLTLPHGLARVVVAEALYRAWSLLGNHPYHRA